MNFDVVKSSNIDIFKQEMYLLDSEQFLNDLIQDIHCNIYESLIDLVIQVPFLNKKEYSLKSLKMILMLMIHLDLQFRKSQY